MNSLPPNATDDGELDETGFRIALGCPGCGGDVVVASADRAARCPFCDLPHLVFGRSPQTVFVVPNRVVGDDAVREAILEDWRHRRLVDLSLEKDGRSTEPLDPIGAEASGFVSAVLSELLPKSLSPGSSLPEAVLAAEVAAWADELGRRTRVVSHRFFHAPYWHVTGRLYEGVVGRDASGTKRAAAGVRGAEFSRNAFDDSLAVPGMGRLSSIRELRPLPREGLDEFTSLAIVNPPGSLDESIKRALGVPLVRELSPIGRRGLFCGRELHLLFRPFHLVELASDGKKLQVLLDGHSRSCAALLADEEAARLVAAPSLDPGQELGTRLALRPMRCPDCAGALPLDRTGEIRFCPSCVRALRVDGESLVKVPYWVEAPPAPPDQVLYLPFWRFEFSLTDPRDGREITSIPMLRERLGGRPTIRPEKSRRGDRFDVPAFRPLDRGKATSVYQHLFAIPRKPIEELIEGPARPEFGFSQPARFVAILEAEATAVARDALILRLDEHDLANVSPARITGLLFEASLRLSAPRLVLRAFRRGDMTPVLTPLGLGR